MRLIKDYTTRKELGIRVKGRESCCVIRFHNGEWIEIGRDHALPLDPLFLAWRPSGVPGSILAVALRIYELDHPGTGLRAFLQWGSAPCPECRIESEPQSVSS